MSVLPAPHRLVSGNFRTPKGCIVHAIELKRDSKRRPFAEVRFRCGQDGMYPAPGGGTSTYPSAHVRGVLEVTSPSTYVSGTGARIDFPLAPNHVTCRKKHRGASLRCTVHTDKGNFTGARAPRRKHKTRRR